MNVRLAIASALIALTLAVQGAAPQATVRLSYGVGEGKAPKDAYRIEDYNAALTQIDGGDRRGRENRVARRPQDHRVDS